jgi:hypothetical protein
MILPAIRMYLAALALVMHVHPSRAVMAANAAALAAEADRPVLGSIVEDAAALMVWEQRESGFSPTPRAYSWDAKAGKSLGVLQQRPGVGDAALEVQVTAWLGLLREGAKTCPESAAAPLSGSCVGARKLADRRMAYAATLVQAISGK